MKNILNRTIGFISSLAARLASPRMLYGFRRSDGVFLPLFRKGSTTYIDHPKSFFPDNHVYIGHHNYLEASQGLHIGEYCQITSFVSITTHSSHDAIRIYGRQYGGGSMKAYVRGAVRIGAFTFVGPHTVIMPGTIIGKGCLIKAYSYVEGNFPDFSIIGGNPAVVTGSTLQRDSKLLELYPELKKFRDDWANENPKS